MKRILFTLTALVLVAAGCGDAGDDAAVTEPTSDSAVHNEADMMFVQGMIPHHQQAVTMSDMALETSDNTEVLALAEQIKAAQQPEIDQMQNLLDQWGAPAGGGMEGMEGMEGMGNMQGMMSQSEMGAMMSAQGGEFDRLFLTGMIRHHQGAVTSSETELAEGESAEAQELAQEIIDAQEAEIAEMETLLEGIA
jgi:uncharacterized protein (DUF305 family)